MHLDKKDDDSLHNDSSSSDKEHKRTLSIIKRYEEFKKHISVSGVPVWVLRYYDGMPESYLDNTGDDKQKD